VRPTAAAAADTHSLLHCNSGFVAGGLGNCALSPAFSKYCSLSDNFLIVQKFFAENTKFRAANAHFLEIQGQR